MFPVLFILCFTIQLFVVHAEEEVLCTHGKLFLSDTTTSQIHVIDLNLVEPVGNLMIETSITVDGGPGGMDVYSTANGKAIATLYGGSIDMNYTDGVINWIQTGIELENHGDHSDVSFVAPTLLPAGTFRCAQAVHFERNNGDIAIFCDGSYNGYINSTVWVVDESTLSDGGADPIVYNTTLLGSHHGVAVPVFENHLLYSVAAPERINRNANASDYSLPSHFDVIDITTGTVIHQLNDTSNVATHCTNYHGAAYFENTIILACDDSHGGVVIVNYNETLDLYSSRALLYPSPTSTTYDNHRAAHFEHHTKSNYIIGDFNNGEDSFNLIAFSPSDTTLTEMNVLPLSTLPCGFAYEQSAGEVILILMPDGMVQAYEFEMSEGWVKIAELQVVDDMSACNQAIFTVGYVQAFVITTGTTTSDTPTIYAVDLHHVHGDGTEEPKMTFTTSSIDFVPYSAVVGGVPPLVACSFDGSDHHHDHGDEEEGANGTATGTNNNNNTAASGTSKSTSQATGNLVVTPFIATIGIVVAMIYSMI